MGDGVLLLAGLLAGLAIGALWGFKRVAPVPQLIALARRVEQGLMARRLHGPDYARWFYGRYVGDLKLIENVPAEVARTDIERLIRIRSAASVDAARRTLYRYVWKSDVLPSTIRPASVVAGHKDQRYADLAGLARIDELVVEMPNGVRSRIYRFHPDRPVVGHVIYHQGHEGDFIDGKALIGRMLAEGYTVAAISMPLLGMNQQDTFETERFGYIPSFGHNTFYLLETEEFAPIRYFLDPVLAAANAIAESSDGLPIIMTGVSGGGWTTVLSAALIPAIVRSYPVAAKLPMYLMALPPNDRNTNNRADLVVGDYEEFVPQIMQTANFLELSVLGGAGPDRRQVQIINKFDPINYRGVGALTYRDPVAEAVAEAGAGAFHLVLDDTHVGHVISPWGLEWIVKDLAAHRASVSSAGSETDRVGLAI